MTKHVSGHRFIPLNFDALGGEQRAFAEKILKFSLNGLSGPFNMMLRSPDAATILLSLGEYMRFRTAISPHFAELAVLVHARVWTDQYEWDMHVNRAAESGLSAAVINDIKCGLRPLSMSGDESAVFDFCVELLKTHAVRDSTFAAAKELLGERSLTDLTIMLGQYAIISMILSVSQAGAGRTSMPVIVDPFPKTTAYGASTGQQ